jgi:hypothetical protein
VRQIESARSEHETDSSWFRKLRREMSRISLVGPPRTKTFFECSASPVVFLIAAAGMDSRGVLAFRMPICEYGKLLF